ncbi:trypsin-like peptidase [Roseiarcus fermentans]|uniref:Trypsin-like peptidase n=1 Tax=Roseiarcus fermentans TaxID=1473586 RepID=A0A366F9R3_9HYPH|nr:serine protease [Roseiarcus fermentans]RBP11403.1 trypsin-like peptidase [Roseiarcus fermentans]
MRSFLATLLSMLACPGLAATASDILANNTHGTVYLEVTDSAGQFIDSGTGFIVSHDGYIVTAAHIKPAAGQTLWAVIGQRQGTRFPLQSREIDEASDVAAWQLPQSASCRYAVTMTTADVHPLDRALVIGFPGQDGLTPAQININNVSTPDGLYKADGFLRNGYSGGPVFNESGNVIGLVHSGTPAGGNNDLIPIALALNLLKKRGVRVGIDVGVPYDNACYASCRAPSHGVERWSSETPWTSNSGELPGGHNESDECAKLIVSTLGGNPNARIDLLPGSGDPSKGMWEESHKDLIGQMHYTYYCQGILRTGPVYVEKQSAACGLWSQ